MISVAIPDLSIPLFDRNEQAGLIVNVNLAMSRDRLSTAFAGANGSGIKELH